MNEILPFAATWMDLENITFSEVSQTENDKYYIISLICGNLKISIQNRNRLTVTENKLMVTRWEKQGQRNKLGSWD